MLRNLSIRDFVIVDAVELELAGGFTVFTGETGAGKSILIDALALALGGRGDASIVREGTAKADISAEFDCGEAVEAWLAANELSSGEGSVLMRRVIDSAGRSRAFINGIAATIAQLRDLGELLVDIHGQHAHQSLLKSEAQRALLDTQAGLLREAKAVAAAHKTWRAIVRQREELEAGAQSVLLERERLEWQVGELERLAPLPDEWERVNEEHKRLSHAASLIEAAQEAQQAIAEADDPILSRLAALILKLGKVAEYDAALKPVLELLEPAEIQLQEAAHALNAYLDRIELDPARLNEVDARLGALHAAARKFHVAPEQLPQELEALSEKLRQLAGASDLEALRAQEEKMQAAYMDAARVLSKARAKAAKALGDAVTAGMQDLSMAGGRFVIALNPCEPASYGLEQIEFLVAGHAGAAPRPLAKVASGGELSRVALAISVIASHATATPTLIFDEVDSGIGGGVAEVVGRLLKRLGHAHQVLCVTHLPQVASQADQHFEVSKISAGGSTSTRITPLDGKARVEEIARMLGGLEITATTRMHARELLAS